MNQENFSVKKVQSGQVTAEYVIVAGILVLALFVDIPGLGMSVVELLVKAFKDSWSAFSYTISLPLL